MATLTVVLVVLIFVVEAAIVAVVINATRTVHRHLREMAAQIQEGFKVTQSQSEQQFRQILSNIDKATNEAAERAKAWQAAVLAEANNQGASISQDLVDEGQAIVARLNSIGADQSNPVPEMPAETNVGTSGDDSGSGSGGEGDGGSSEIAE